MAIQNIEIADGDELNVVRVSSVDIGLIVINPIGVVPQNYEECDGKALSRTEYADLFALLGTTYGDGDGSTTFNIPDLRGEFVRGWDNGKGTDSGRTMGSNQDDQMESHNHSTTIELWTSGTWNNNKPIDQNSHSLSANYNVNTSNAGGTENNSENRPRNIAMMYCIKVK